MGEIAFMCVVLAGNAGIILSHRIGREEVIQSTSSSLLRRMRLWIVAFPVSRLRRGQLAALLEGAQINRRIIVGTRSCDLNPKICHIASELEM